MPARELGDPEADWAKLQHWRKRNAARDFFGAASQAEAGGMLARARVALEAFTTRVYVYEREDPPASPGKTGDGCQTP